MLFKSAAGSMALKVIGAAFGLLNGILIARMLGPAEFGIYSIVIAAVTLLSTLAALGLPSLVTREVAVHQAKAEWAPLKEVMRSSHLWVMTSSLVLIFAAVIVAIGFMRSYPLSVTAWITLLLLMPLTAFNLLRSALLRGMHFVVAADIPDLIVRPVLLTLGLTIFYLLAIRLDNSLALVLYAVSTVFAFLVGSWLLMRGTPWQVKSSRPGGMRENWASGTTIFLAITLLGMLENQLPLYMLGFISKPENVALFQASIQIVSVIIMGLMAVNLPLQPKLAAAWGSGNLIQAQQLVTESARMSSIFAVLAALVLLPFAEEVLRVYGPHYSNAAWALRILIVGQLINALAGSCGVVLAMTGHQKLLLLGLICALIVNIIVSIFAIPALGAVGAALATAVSLLFWNMLLMFFAWKKTGLRTYIKF